MILLGVDPGFASFGWAVVHVNRSSGGPSEELIAGGVIRTQKSPRKQKILATEDTLRRAQEIDTELGQIFLIHEPDGICAESMSWPRNAAVTGKMGVAWGVLASCARGNKAPIFQTSPQALKKKICGSSKASKEEVKRRVLKWLGGTAFKKIVRPIPKGQREHLFDAVGAVLACLDADGIQLALRNEARR